MDDDERRLTDLLREPRESLDVEIKGWLDIQNNGEHKAVLAKAMIALANHGGGFIILGFEETADDVVPAQGKPKSLSLYNQDTINGIVHRYAEPPFHCAVAIKERSGTREKYPIIVVPGVKRVPIRSKRPGPNGRGIEQNVFYVRRPGPRSESPQTGQEWDDLIRRCVSASRTDLLNSIRDILSGRVTESEPTAAQLERKRLDSWFEESLARWIGARDKLPPDSAARCPHGHWWVAYTIEPISETLNPYDLLEIMRRDRIKHTGWPPWWVPTRDEIRPVPQGDGIECWLGRDNEHGDRDAANSDFWRASPTGIFFLLRGYEEDGSNIEPDQPGTILSLVRPIWRVGECLRHAEDLARNIAGEGSKVLFHVGWKGLQGRWLRAPNRFAFFDPYQWKSDDSSISTIINVEGARISDTLTEIVWQLLTPLYQKFDFYQLPKELVQSELEIMLNQRF